MILAPLRGVTISCFRDTFEEVIAGSGFTEAITPFIAAMPGVDPLKSEELKPSIADRTHFFKLTPQFIGKDPVSLRYCLERVKAAGYDTADLNCGCPFPMVRNKGRGSGILKTPDVLRRMMEVGCEVMGAGRFSIKTRLGVDGNEELIRLIPMINEFPLRFLTVHARNARQMYDGVCDQKRQAEIIAASKVPVVVNGDIPFPPLAAGAAVFDTMIGRSFIRYLGTRDDVGELLDRYVEASKAELYGERPVLGRMKELMAYWKELPRWRRLWPILKLARSLDELRIW